MRSARIMLLTVAAVAAGALAGCGLTDPGENVVNGKQLFVDNCGSCHTLARAGTRGVTGPNLDQSFQRARQDGFGEGTFQGIVHRQILQPAINPSWDPQTGKRLEPMPANLVTGDDAEDVAAYVAQAVARGGEDSGRLAEVGEQQAEGTAEAENGTLTIPATGSASYQFADATAEAGQLKIDSPNESQADHNIALEGNGLNELGPVVGNGETSTIEVEVQAGEYTFFCSVPGHREAGMEGPLRVE
jgi:mono/diheme cytochrome c family protein